MRILSYNLAVIIFILCFSNLTIAQITITADDILKEIGTHETIVGDSSATVDVGSSGENQTWDFRNISMQDSLTLEFEYLNPKQTSFANSFPESNIAARNTDYYMGLTQQAFDFYKVSTTSMVDLGGQVPVNSSLIFKRDTVLVLPLSYGSTWTTVTTDTNKILSIVFSIETDSTVNTVDAYGTIHLPAGDFECLRIRMDEINTIQNSFPTPSVETKTYIEYHWVSKNDLHLASAKSQPNETDPNFTSTSEFERLDTLNGNMVAIRDKKNQPRGFKLLQNYPNPFNPSTTIKFEVPEQSFVTIKVYNILGQEVATLVNGVKKAGSYEDTFNASNLSSGIYFYRLKTRENTLTKKMILLK